MRQHLKFFTSPYPTMHNFSNFNCNISNSSNGFAKVVGELSAFFHAFLKKLTESGDVNAKFVHDLKDINKGCCEFAKISINSGAFIQRFVAGFINISVFILRCVDFICKPLKASAKFVEVLSKLTTGIYHGIRALPI